MTSTFVPKKEVAGTSQTLHKYVVAEPGYEPKAF